MGSGFSMSDDVASILQSVPPSPTSVSPSTGVIGLVVTVRGSGLSSVSGVQVGGMQSLAVVVIDDTLLTALVPTVSLGNKPVLLQSPNGNALVPGGFTVTL